ncbi:MAG: diaminopimelate epimerase [Chloroflexi bacterium]|nr:diaminopimelate epimerase [Chloroflexota bacterium]
MKFVKMHGTGNDFILIDARHGPARAWPALARAMCDRHFGIGADGLLLVQESQMADARMVMYNPDGSEAEMCGNGIRCFAKYLYDQGITRRTDMTVETAAGIKRLEIEVHHGHAERVTVDMGAPVFDPASIPVDTDRPEAIDLPLMVDGRALSLTAVSMGNPHAVHFLDEAVSAFPLERIGPLVERDPLFPRRVNFEIARIRGSSEVDVRVWERGAGLTLACGTGACAVFAAARRKGLVENRACLHLPGGDLDLREGPNGHILMAGPAVLVFTGDWPEAADG